MALRLPMRRLLMVAVAAGMVAAASAENRVETLSGRDLGLKLVEIDVGQKFALGFRKTQLGAREGTQEAYFRLERQRQTAANDPRDKRTRGMKNPLSGVGSIHVGVVGLEVDGSRGNPMAVRAGIYGLGRVKEDLMGITELAYQSGTFGGDQTRPKNNAGLYSRMGFRKGTGNGFYGEVDYSFSPGVEREWMPGVRVGMTF